MKTNMGTADKGVRILIAIVISLLYYYDIIGETLAYILMGIAIILLITSLLNFCPLYRLLGLNTSETKS